MQNMGISDDILNQLLEGIASNASSLLSKTNLISFNEQGPSHVPLQLDELKKFGLTLSDVLPKCSQGSVDPLVVVEQLISIYRGKISEIERSFRDESSKAPDITNNTNNQINELSAELSVIDDQIAIAKNIAGRLGSKMPPAISTANNTLANIRQRITMLSNRIDEIARKNDGVEMKLKECIELADRLKEELHGWRPINPKTDFGPDKKGSSSVRKDVDDNANAGRICERCGRVEINCPHCKERMFSSLHGYFEHIGKQ